MISTRVTSPFGFESTAAEVIAGIDLRGRGSVDQLVRDLAGPLHILVNNAGVMAVPELRLSPPTPPGSPPTRSTPKPPSGSGPRPSR